MAEYEGFSSIFTKSEYLSLEFWELDFVEFLQIKRCKTEDVTPEDIKERQVLVAQIKEFGQMLVGRQINLGDLILESREDLEKRV